MEPTEPRETAAEIEQAAADWVARSDRGPLSPDEEIELERWAAADPRRAGAYARAMAVNLHLDRVVALGDDFATKHQVAPEPSRRRFMAVAAGAMAACAAGVAVLTVQRRPIATLTRPIGTAKGAVRDVALREGSMVTLNTMTVLQPDLTAAMRRIDLLKGEALFDVAKDPARPFVVVAGDFSVRAVGTRFSVRRIGTDAIKVVVTEGVVEISRRQDILGLIHAGIAFAAAAADTPVIETLTPAQIGSALAWRSGRIDLQGLTLAEAIAEFGRYSDVRITLANPAIGRIPITGVYAANDPAGFAENVAISLGLKSARRGDEVVLSSQ